MVWHNKPAPMDDITLLVDVELSRHTIDPLLTLDSW